MIKEMRKENMRWTKMVCVNEFKKIKERVFKPIKELNAEIRTIENEQDEDKTIYWVVEVGLCESMGEQGYIYTLLYDDKPKEDEIIKDTREHIKEQIKDFENEFALGYREEEQLKVLKRY